MKKIFLPLLSTLLLAACSGDKKSAQSMYEQAQQYYNAGDYVAATQWIDSISVTYPQEVEVIRNGMLLQCNVNQKRYEKELLTIDSLYNANNALISSLKPQFTLHREGSYQSVGNYIYKGLPIAGETTRSELRVHVTENGELQLTSVYCGNDNINHTGITVTTASGSVSTQTVAYDGKKNYRYKAGDKCVELVTYNLEQCRDVLDAITANLDNKVTVKYNGKGSYTITLDKKMRQAIASSYELSTAMLQVDSLHSRREYSILQLELADRQLMKLQENAEKVD